MAASDNGFFDATNRQVRASVLFPAGSPRFVGGLLSWLAEELPIFQILFH